MAQRRNHSTPSPQPLDKAIIDRLHNEAQMSYGAIAKHLGTNYARVYRAAHPTPSNRDHGALNSAPLVQVMRDDALERREVVGEPIGAPDSAPHSAPRLNDLEARVSVLEAFIATLQRQPPQTVGAPNGTLRSAPTTATKKRGFVIACDLSDALDAYAEASGLQVRDILDMALRRYLAGEGER
jgi:hypothetical protein